VLELEDVFVTDSLDELEEVFVTDSEEEELDEEGLGTYDEELEEVFVTDSEDEELEEELSSPPASSRIAELSSSRQVAEASSLNSGISSHRLCLQITSSLLLAAPLAI